MGNDQKVGEDSREVSEVNEDQNERSSMEGKGKRLWKKVRYQLVEYHSLPGYLRDNEFIIGHYRSEWPLKHTLLSIFTIHNETLNVWTHLIGFFLFLSLTIYTAMKVPKVVDLYSLQHFADGVKHADLHKLQEELLACLPSLTNIPDLHRLREELAYSLSTMDLLPSPSTWHIPELLTNCLPERFSHGNQTDVCVLVHSFLIALWLIVICINRTFIRPLPGRDDEEPTIFIEGLSRYMAFKRTLTVRDRDILQDLPLAAAGSRFFQDLSKARWPEIDFSVIEPDGEVVHVAADSQTPREDTKQPPAPSEQRVAIVDLQAEDAGHIVEDPTHGTAGDNA
ncbi:hypothetical protein U1Q18_046536 [Sarracenia purpurea var. burkii]